MSQTTHAAPRKQTTSGSHREHGTASSFRVWALCFGLVILAAVPRLTNLTGIGFHGDEDITAFAVRSALETGAPAMPSGMPYLRGLAYTWLTAASVAFFGSADEAPYRLPSALFGILTVPLLFLAGRRLVGARAAFTAAVLLALSSWHMFYSQHARMYALFLFLFLAAAYAILAWQRSGKWPHLGLAVLLSLSAATLHLLGMLLAVVFLVPYVTGRPLVKWWASAGGAALVAAAALAYNRFYVAVPYQQWRATRGALPPAQPRERMRLVAGIEDYLFDLPLAVAVLLPVAALLLGLWIGWRSTAGVDGEHDPLRRSAIIAGAGMAGLLTGVGQLYGAAVAAALVLVITPGNRLAGVRRAPAALAGLGFAAAGWLLSHVVRYGPYEGLKAAAAWPYWLPVHLVRQFAVPMLMFFAVTVWLAMRQPRAGDEGIRLCVLIAWLPLLALGFVSKSEATRYLIELYPFILLAVAAGLVAALDAVLTRAGTRRALGGRVAAVAAVALAASGLLTGHGVPQAAASMQATAAAPHVAGEFPWHPDHRSAARWLAAQRTTGDVVIGEDPLALRWYGVIVDYWLRRVNDARQFLYRDDAGVLREFYGNSELLADTGEADTIVAAAQGRVWLVTSAETHLLPGWYLSAEQRQWLDEIRARIQPAYVAEDGITSVYCINCQGTGER
jgi:uncharacterized membrane protein